MNKVISITIVMALILASCGVSQEDFDKLQSELKKTKKELANCSSELTKIRDTPEQRFLRANKMYANKDLLGAKKEYKGIVDNYKGTNDANIASKKIARINKIIEKNRIAEERKKTLGFRILKPTSFVKFADLSLKFSKIWIGKRWSFDDYGNKHFLIDAQRGNKHILARVSITSKSTNPFLPPILAYQIKDGELKLLGTLGYKFRRWKNYGSYLGNYADYGNDFSHSKTIPFNLGLELPNEKLNNNTVFIVMKKMGCFKRLPTVYGSPDVKYQNETFDPKKTLKIEDFDINYVVLKIFNKSKL